MERQWQAEHLAGLNSEQRQSRQNLVAGGSIERTARMLWAYDKVGNRTTQAVSNYDGIGINAPSTLKSTYNTSYSYNNDWILSTNSIRNDVSSESTFVTNYEYNQNGSQTAVKSNVGKPEEKRVPYFCDFKEKLIGIGNATDTANIFILRMPTATVTEQPKALLAVRQSDS